jgi:hypothetical protein
MPSQMEKPDDAKTRIVGLGAADDFVQRNVIDPGCKAFGTQIGGPAFRVLGSVQRRLQ